MFTGLIEVTAVVQTLQYRNKSLHIGIIPSETAFVTQLGCSIAVNGVCLTVDAIENVQIYFSAVDHTLSHSTLADLKRGDRVNIEQALAVGSRFEGHMVLGHADGIATIVQDRWCGESLIRSFELADDLMPFLARKGSVAVDGISLTISEKRDTIFSVSFIPYTLRHTTMGKKKSGDRVNVECDVLSRYVAEHLLINHKNQGCMQSTGRPKPNTLQQLMENSGF